MFLLIQAQIGQKDLAKEFLSNLREAGVDIDKEDILSLTLVPVAAGFSREKGFTGD